MTSVDIEASLILTIQACNATWLQVTHTGGSPDQRPLLGELVDPTLGLHILDVNIALGNLVQLVRTEAGAYHSS